VSFNAWITLAEFPKWLKFAIWACGEKRFGTDYSLLIKRIRRLVKTNGWNFTFKYLKECLRIVVQYLAGNPQTSRGRNAVGVRVNQYGLPVIIPPAIRSAIGLADSERVTTRTLLTVLSIFRTFPTKVKPDLESIIAPFTGITRTLDDIGGVAKAWVGKELRLPSIRGFISESAGPIAKRATWGAPCDAFALLGYPKIAWQVLHILSTSKGGRIYAFSLLVLWALFLVPFFTTLVMFGSKSLFPLGRLSVVYDQAGKARIVAMANWWIQLTLLPLHEGIFSLLRGKECDGTFNQTAPLKRLMKDPQNGHKFSCFDLSSATDRLPMLLQIEILNAIGVNGYQWSDLLSFPYYYKGEPVEYSVGQPMGAYSSWAMLALTHHLIVMLAAQRAGIKGFNSYAVLGDDIVINNDAVAAEYLLIMKALGVGINLSKSLISGDFAEFAKRYVSPTFDISPIGAGNLLQAVRRPRSIGSLIVELYEKGIVENFNSGLIPLYQSLPVKEPFSNLVLWTWWMLCSALVTTHSTISQETDENTSGALNHPDLEKTFSPEFLAVLRMEMVQDLLKSYSRAKSEEAAFWKCCRQEIQGSRKWSIKLITAFGFFVSPVFWLYRLALLRSTESIRTMFVMSSLLYPGSYGCTVSQFVTDHTPMLISMRVSKKQVRDQIKFVKALTSRYQDIMDRSRSRY
jgi:hypothetical protein